jgi:hypothetical protein
VRPPGHHAGPRGVVTNENDNDGSHGFCLLNNVGIGAAYALNVHRNNGIKVRGGGVRAGRVRCTVLNSHTHAHTHTHSENTHKHEHVHPSPPQRRAP